jgi:hypothetical protein
MKLPIAPESGISVNSHCSFRIWKRNSYRHSLEDPKWKYCMTMRSFVEHVQRCIQVGSRSGTCKVFAVKVHW